MNPSLPPPFGDSVSIMDRNILEGITFAIFIAGVPTIGVAVGVAVLLIYWFGKKLYTNRYRGTVRDNKDAAITTCTEAVGISCASILVIITALAGGLVLLALLILLGLPVAIAILVIAIGGILLGIVIGGIGIVVGVLVSCPIWIFDVILYYCCDRGKDPNFYDCCEICKTCTLPKYCKHHPNQKYCECKWYTDICKLFTCDNIDKYSAALITPLFTSVTKNSNTGRSCLLFAERKDPEDKLSKIAVRMYFLIAILLALLWFVALLADNLWYQKVTTCNDVNPKINNYICYEIDSFGNAITSDTGTSVDCEVEQTRDVLCYIYTFSPFMALTIASSITRTIVFAVDAVFTVSLSLAESKYGCALLTTVQVLAVCIGSTVFLIVIPVLYTHLGRNISAFKWFFQGRSGVRTFIFILTVSSIALLPLVPWCAFQEKQSNDTSQENPESRGAYGSTDEAATEGMPLYPRGNIQDTESNHPEEQEI